VPRKCALEFAVQRLPNSGQWVVDLWNTLDGEPLGDSNRIFDTKEEALTWVEEYKPGKYPVRSVSFPQLNGDD
jgi:hypothetical protein